MISAAIAVQQWAARMVLLTALTIAQQLSAAAIPAPSTVLLNPRTQVVIASFVERLVDGRYRFAKVEDVHGMDETPDDLLLRAPDWLAIYLRRDEQYLLAFSNYRPNPRFLKDQIIDTDGPRMINAFGLEPALFRNAPGLDDALLHSPDALQSASFVARVVAGLESTDTQLQNFYAAEVTQLGELRKQQGPVLIAAIKGLIGNPYGHPSARAGLLRLAASQPQIYSREFLASTLSMILQHAPLEGYQDQRPRSGELVRIALELTIKDSLKISTATLERLISCDSAALSEAALLAIRQLDPTRERDAATAALAQTLLPVTTREFLLDHIRRLDLAAESTLLRKPDTN